MKMLTVSEVTQRLGFKQANTVYEMIRTGQLPVYRLPSKPGGCPRLRVSEDDLQKFLEQHRTTATPPI